MAPPPNLPPPIPSTPRRGLFRMPAVDPRSCVLINLLAFPGLGTILARRRWGYPQAAIMVAGFLLATAFMGFLLRAQLRAALAANPNLTSEWGDIAWMGWWGFGLCAGAWIRSAFSCIGMVRQGPAAPGPVPSPQPPSPPGT